jgi:hypothetical protein
MPAETVICPVCRHKFKRFAFYRRKTCSKRCLAELKRRNGLAASPPKRPCERKLVAQENIESRLIAEKAVAVRIRERVYSGEPRRKCPECLRRVRLVNSVAGAVWLRPHKINGELCPGSRLVVSYPREKEVANDD